MPSHLRALSAHAVQLQPRRSQRRVREASARDRARDSAHRYGGAAPRLEAVRQGSHPASLLPAAHEPVVPRRGRQRFGGEEARWSRRVRSANVQGRLVACSKCNHEDTKTRRTREEDRPKVEGSEALCNPRADVMPSRSESLKEAGAPTREPVADGGRTRWGDRAAALYTEAYAERYRAHDESIGPAHAVVRLSDWLHAVCDRFERPIDALDLGCGTGRYFHALSHVRRLVGIDVSPAMLDRARRPAGTIALVPGWLTLVEGDFLTHEFQADEFDLVCSIGVLAEHSPFDMTIAARVQRWLRPGGSFAFTNVHSGSFSVTRTLKRRA